MGALTAWFDLEFDRLYSDWRELIQSLDPEQIYQRSARGRISIGKNVVSIASEVEQTFGGITANLWDDPFEWTLPESLANSAKVLEYFDEVEATRRRGFELLQNDEELVREVMTPAGTMPLASLLLDTLVRARQHQLSAVRQQHERR